MHDVYDLCTMSIYKSAPLETLNFSSGTSKLCFTKLLRKSHKDAKNKDNLKRADWIPRQSVDNFNIATYITANLLREKKGREENITRKVRQSKLMWSIDE